MTQEKKKPEKEKKAAGIIEKLKKVKHIEIIIAVGFIAILLLIYFAGNSSIFNIFKSNGSSNTGSSNNSSDISTYAGRMESKLTELICSIKGVDNAEVMINFESTPELVIAYIENESVKSGMDGNGNYTEDKTSSSTPVIITQSGNQLALVLKEIAPSISGVMIVAKGANDTKVKLDIINAVSILLNINANKIAVLEKK